MNSRILYGKNTPLTFRESIRFSPDCPYKIRYKDFANDDIAPPHYAQTVEVGVCCGITGEVITGGTRLQIRDRAVYVIPPGIVHSTVFQKGEGHIYVLHISLEDLAEFVNVKALLRQSGKTFAGMGTLCPEFDRVHRLVQEMIRRDAEPFARTRALLDILELLTRQMPAIGAGEPEDSRSEELHRILRWTEANFTKAVHLEQAAAVVGFTKNYFCTWFKGKTGQTYNQYLNHVRINHACRVLLQSGSLSAACYDSGFQNMSYFIQMFKKAQGCTPGAYLHNAEQEGGG